MAYGQGFAGGFADQVEAPVHHHGGGGRRARYRFAPWAPPKPPEAPPKPDPVTIRVAVHLTCSMSARATTLGTWVTIPGPRFRCSARLTGPPLLVALHDLDVRSRKAEELAELGLAVAYIEARW